MTNNPFDSGDDKKRRYPEYRLHVATLKHVNSAFIGPQNPNLKIFHYPAETRDATDAFFKKQMGVESGFLDFILGWPNNTGVLEIKPPGKTLSSSQNRFISWAKLIGWHTGVAHTVRQAHFHLCTWGLVASHQQILEPDYRTEQKKFSDSYDFYAPRKP